MDLTTREAAERLGLTPRRVRQLVDQGDLEAQRVGRDLFISPESVARLQATRGTGRPLSERTAWAVLLSNVGLARFDAVIDEFGLSRSEQGRIRALRHRPLEDWAWLARRRASVRRFSVRDAYLDDLLRNEAIIRSGVSAVREHDVPLTAGRGGVELYTDEANLAALISRYLLRPDGTGSVVVHVLSSAVFEAVRHIVDGPVMPPAVVAADLAESVDARTRRAGLDLMARATR